MKHITDLLKKKEWLLHKKEPLFNDVDIFLKKEAPAISKHVTSLRYTDGILTLGAKSSPAMQEVFLIKQNLLTFLKEKKYPIRDISTRFLA
jgi:hypothetical protein